MTFDEAHNTSHDKRMHSSIKNLIKHLGPTWQALLLGECSKPYMQQLEAFLTHEYQQNKIIYPPNNMIFNALNFTDFNKVKIVILGQDPYHGSGQAHGLCFSVPAHTKSPPSLQNIFKELHDDLNIPIAKHGNLSHWAEQGVLLLNSVLTVEQGMPGSHQGMGWETFTDAIIAVLNKQTEHLVFILWGSYAQKKGAFIDTSKHLVIEAPHPSPLSAYRGFFDGEYFSRSNAYLKKHGKTAIHWQLPHSAETHEKNVHTSRPHSPFE